MIPWPSGWVAWCTAAVVAATLGSAGDPQSQRPLYKLPRDREVVLLNDAGEPVEVAVMLVNPFYGTRSAYYGIDRDWRRPGGLTVPHSLPSATATRYELKRTERMRVRLLDDGQDHHFVLQPGRNYRLDRTAQGAVDLAEVQGTQTVVIRSELRDDVYYELLLSRGGLAARSVLITLAPGSEAHHNIVGPTECLLGLERPPVVRPRVTLIPGRRYVFRYDEQGRVVDEFHGAWDLFPGQRAGPGRKSAGEGDAPDEESG